MKKDNKTYKYSMILIFAVFIGTMIVLDFITPEKVFSQEENRILQKSPKFSLNHLLDGRFKSQYENYISDQFPFRDFFIGVKSDVEKVLGKKENNEIYLASDGYLMEQFKLPGDDNIKDKTDIINSFDKTMPDVKKYITIIPNSFEILKDKLPKYAPRGNEYDYIKKIKDYLNDDISFIDVYDTLYSKRSEYIYYKTDHHWTTKAAFYAYEKLSESMGFSSYPKEDFDIEEITDSFYGSLYSKGGVRHIKGDNIELYYPKFYSEVKVKYIEENKETNTFYDMENINKKDKYAVFFNGNHPLIKISSDAKEKDNLLVLKDSYANCLLPFLSLHYKNIYVVDLRYYDQDLKKLINENNIKEMVFLYNVKTFSENNFIKNLLST